MEENEEAEGLVTAISIAAAKMMLLEGTLIKFIDHIKDGDLGNTCWISGYIKCTRDQNTLRK
jgi:hypothetical protein